MEVQNGLGATGTGASVLGPSPLGGPGSSPVLQGVRLKPALLLSPASAFPQRVSDRKSDCLGGGPCERMRRAALTSLGLKFHPSSSWNLSSLCPPLSSSFLEHVEYCRSSPHPALHPVLIGMGAVGLDCWANLNLAGTGSGIKVLGICALLAGM